MEDVILELQKSVLKKKKKRRNRIAYSSLSRWESASYDGLRWLRLLVLLILDEQQQIALFLLLFFLHFFQKLLASFLFFYLIEPSRYSPSSLLCRFPFCRQKKPPFSLQILSAAFFLLWFLVFHSRLPSFSRVFIHPFSPSSFSLAAVCLSFLFGCQPMPPKFLLAPLFWLRPLFYMRPPFLSQKTPFFLSPAAIFSLSV